MKKIYIIGFLFFSQSVYAEDLNQIFTRLNKFVEKKNFTKAIDELAWAKKELEKMHNDKLKSFLPAELVGYKAGEIQAQNAFGFNTIERTYSAVGNSFSLALSGGVSQNNPLSGLAAIAKMGQMIGASQPGVETYREQGKTVSLNTNNAVEAIISLESGSILTLKSSNKSDIEIIKNAIKELELEELDNYLRGS